MPIVQCFAKVVFCGTLRACGEQVPARLWAAAGQCSIFVGQLFVEDEKHFFRTALPFLQRWTRIPDNYEEIYQRMVSEIEQPDFVATVRVVTAWGTKALA